jgi:glycosyltransferase involved in cell wall biosynthesis
VDVLLEAMARYLKAGWEGHLHMFGGGPLGEWVHERASQEDLRGRVSVGGYTTAEMVVSYLAACDCLVIPSRLESIPVILSDALQMGKPVLASDVGDMGDLLREHPAGLVVPAENPIALAEAMREMATTDRGRFIPHIRALAETFNLVETARSWTRQLGGVPGG